MLEDGGGSLDERSSLLDPDGHEPLPDPLDDQLDPDELPDELPPELLEQLSQQQQPAWWLNSQSVSSRLSPPSSSLSVTVRR